MTSPYYDYASECHNLVARAKPMDTELWVELAQLLSKRSVIQSFFLWVLTLAQEEQNMLVNMDDDTPEGRRATLRLKGRILAKSELVDLAFTQIAAARDGSMQAAEEDLPLPEGSGGDPDLDTSFVTAPTPRRQSPQGFARIVRPAPPPPVARKRPRAKPARKTRRRTK